MTIEFQDNILKFCLNTKEGRKYLPLLDEKCFDLPDRRFVFDLIDKYRIHYNTVPSRVNLVQYFDVQKGKTQIDEGVEEVITKCIDELYVENFVSDTKIIREEILKFSQRKLMKKLVEDKAEGISEADTEFFDKMLYDMAKIVNMGKDVDDSNNRGNFVLKDFRGVRNNFVEGAPTYLKALNRMTNSNGFKTPELIILLGAPKSFKTGTLINIGVEYMRDGLKGYYVDCENGHKAIETRIYQCMMRSAKRDLYKDEEEKILTEMIKRFKVLGGDIKVDHFPANTKSCADVDAELQYLFDEFGWVPDFIMWDYPDLMNPEDKSIKEKRLKIQAVYHDIIRLHNKWGVFGIGISQVNKDAVGKEVINMKAFAEDFGKAANAHAAFAICRTEEEMEQGVGRIIPVMQREGVMFTGTQTCFIEIDPEKMRIDEILNEPSNLKANAVRRSENTSRKSEPSATMVPNTRFLKDE